MQKVYQLKVIQVDRETPDSVTIHFAQAKVHRVWYTSGQFITLVFRFNGEIYYRSYSICTCLQLDDTLAFTVKRVKGGLVSNHLNDDIQVGDELEFLQPAGRFIIENSVKFRRQVFLFGGGSGITPLFSMLRSVLFNEPNSKVSLVYANRNKEDIIFFEKIQELETLFPNRLQVIWYLSQGNAETGFRQGRISRKEIPGIVESLKEPAYSENLYFICGPSGMMEEVEAGLDLMNVDPALISKERFFVEPDPPEINQKQPPREVRVQYGPDIHAFTVPPGAKILPAALVQDIVLPFSCLKGSCATCMGKVLGGKVEMVRNEGLTDLEVQQGYVLVCQAKPLGEGVKIRMGR